MVLLISRQEKKAKTEGKKKIQNWDEKDMSSDLLGQEKDRKKEELGRKNQ